MPGVYVCACVHKHECMCMCVCTCVYSYTCTQSVKTLLMCLICALNTATYFIEILTACLLLTYCDI